MLSSATRLTLLATIVITAASCTAYLHTSTVASYELNYQLRGSIAVVPFRTELFQSQEFGTYRQKVEDQLLRIGYDILPNPDEAQQVAIISYGVDLGQTKIVTTTTGAPSPDGGGGHERWHKLSTIYQHVFAMEIVNSLSLKMGDPKILLEIKTTSEGTCFVIDKVMDDLIEATFTGFPPISGEVVERKVSSMVDC